MELTYKGFSTTAYTNLDEGVFYGKLEGIVDLVAWECNCESGVKSAFYEAVDDHIETCKSRGKGVSLS